MLNKYLQNYAWYRKNDKSAKSYVSSNWAQNFKIEIFFKVTIKVNQGRKFLLEGSSAGWMVRTSDLVNVIHGQVGVVKKSGVGVETHVYE